MNVKEEEIRPQKVFNEYLELAKKDIVTFFSNVEAQEIQCPACGGIGDVWVRKSNFTYKKCNVCFTIYVSPRPIRAAFDNYYTDSKSTKFWATTFYKITEDSRRKLLWKPKAQLVKNIIEKHCNNQSIEYVIDIGGGYGVFDEEILKITDIKPVIVEPSVHLAKICREKGLIVVEKFMEDILPNELPDAKKCFVSFELFEHLHDPSKFLENLFEIMNKNDLFIFTTLSGIGVDIQVLGEHSKSLSPPHHLNFLNPKSVSLLLKKLGFEVLEASTPGKLDLDIIKNNKEFITDNFWKNIIEYLNTEELEMLQDDIASKGLSSHMMITCRKN